MRKHWHMKVTETAMKAAECAGVDCHTFRVAMEAFEDLCYVESPALRHDVQAISCTGGRLFRQKPSRPLYLRHYRSIFAVVRQDHEDGTRGTLVLLAVLPRDPHTYTPKMLNALIQDVISEAKRKRVTAL